MRLYGPLLAGLLLFSAAPEAAEPETTAPTPDQATEEAGPLGLDVDAVTKPWIGDLDGMRERKYIRILVPYSKTFYFIEKGTERGIIADFYREFERSLNKKKKAAQLVHVVFVPVSRDQLLPWLAEGRGDIAAAGLTVTEARLKQVDFAEASYENAREVVVAGANAPALNSLDDLAGKSVFVRPSSSYAESLKAFNAQLKSRGLKEVELKPAPETFEDEDMMEMANAGVVDFLVVDEPLAVLWAKVFPNIKVLNALALRDDGKIAPALRKNSPQLKAVLDGFLKTHKVGTSFGNTQFERYLKNVKYIKSSTSQAEMKKLQQLAEFFRKYGDKYEVDWLLAAAQGYQESRLNNNAKSHVGAIGVMQVMPATGKELKVGDIRLPEANVHAGVKYIRFMIDEYYKDEPMDQLNKALFTFASYNAGPGRIRSMRALAAKRGLNPNVWFNNVERVTAEKVGREPVQYVSNIYKYYVAYKLVTEQRVLREQQKQGAKPKGT